MNLRNAYPVLLTIAGSDPSGGAGIQADIKTAQQLGIYAASVITSVTVQNSLAVASRFDIPAETVGAQLRQVLADFIPDAIKIGMLPTPEIIIEVAEILAELKRNHDIPIVIDPVLISSSGHPLSEPIEVNAKLLIDRIFPLASLVTPNIPELEFLSGMKSPENIDESNGIYNARLRAQNILVKGGHADSRECIDFIIGESPARVVSPRIESRNTHGTGCVLSSAIACGLACGLKLPAALAHAKRFMDFALAKGADCSVGKGAGPLYLFAPEEYKLYR